MKTIQPKNRVLANSPTAALRVSESPSLTRSRPTVDSQCSPSGCLWQSISLRSVGSPSGLRFAQSVSQPAMLLGSQSLHLSSFNPALPEDGALVIASVLRDQFNGLATLISEVPVIDAAAVDGVSTLPAGDPAAVAVSVEGNVLHFTFSIPQGYQGLQGIQGYQGEPGAQGPPFAQALVDAVNTLEPGQPATVSVYFDGTNVRFTFGIPRGETGGTGDQGEQGPPGEVTNSALANAISGTSNNTNAVSTLGLVVSDPPTQGEMQSIVNKVDELILALRK